MLHEPRSHRGQTSSAPAFAAIMVSYLSRIGIRARVGVVELNALCMQKEWIVPIRRLALLAARAGTMHFGCLDG
jgi:hypothetical protein